MHSQAVYCWGLKSCAGRAEKLYAPTKLSGFPKDTTFVDITAGGLFMMALTDNGQVWSWGVGKFGRLGHGNEEDSSSPQLIAGLADKQIGSISAGQVGAFESDVFLNVDSGTLVV